VKEYSDNLESKTQISEKSIENMMDEKTDTKETMTELSEMKKSEESSKNILDVNSDNEDQDISEENGGCLIATAAFGSELAPQVQFLREVRDNTIMNTASGVVFMTEFNQWYYSFSPTIADWERENPMFQEAVRAFITPMILTLSIMTLADDSSEIEVIGLGMSVIGINLGMYLAVPIVVVWQIKKRL